MKYQKILVNLANSVRPTNICTTSGGSTRDWVALDLGENLFSDEEKMP